MSFNPAYLFPSDEDELDSALVIVPGNQGIVITILDASGHASVAMHYESIEEFIKILKSLTSGAPTSGEVIKIS